MNLHLTWVLKMATFPSFGWHAMGTINQANDGKEGNLHGSETEALLEVNFPHERQWGRLFGMMAYTVWSLREDVHMRNDKIILRYHPFLSMSFGISLSSQSCLRFGHHSLRSAPQVFHAQSKFETRICLPLPVLTDHWRLIYWSWAAESR